jgi:hypothetical protein
MSHAEQDDENATMVGMPDDVESGLGSQDNGSVYTMAIRNSIHCYKSCGRKTAGLKRRKEA